MNLLRAEWIKSKSVLSTWVLLAIALVITLGMAGLMSYLQTLDIEDANGDSAQMEFSAGDMVASTFGSFPSMLVWVVAIVLICGEYRSGTIKNVFAVAPRRWDVYLVKTGFFIVAGAVISFVFTFLALILTYLVTGSDSLAPWSGDALLANLRFTAYMAIAMVAMVGISFLLRNVAGTITLVIGWVFIIESVLSNLPRIGDAIGSWMPFQNGMAWAMDSAGSEFTKSLDNPANILWFLAFALLLWVGGLFALYKRDA
ncbi:ABC transporter permease [Dietzia timorensis]|uniref:ABC transporter permease n=1 Tax=Dietzia timorensis TaxID=499555 RepID=A0A173LRE0_9ACTN|nr:ABC transporter permease [Dietzia timorensis]ANI93592.1 Hypothetical protein BJL86_2832 [Dietzia timorensis]